MRRAAVAAALLLSLVLAPGCMMFCPQPSPKRFTACGEIKICDFATCRRLRVLDHTFERDDEGRLIVWVTWLNVSGKPYKARIRRAFFDENGLPEQGSFRWDRGTFPPGEQPSQWTSYSKDAVRYRIDVERAR